MRHVRAIVSTDYPLKAERKAHAETKAKLNICRSISDRREIIIAAMEVEMEKLKLDSKRIDLLEQWEPGSPDELWRVVCDWLVSGKSYPAGLREALDALGAMRGAEERG